MFKWLELITTDLTPDQRKAVVIVFWRAVQVTFIMGAVGLFSWAGVQGFAWAGDLKGVKQDVSQVEAKVSAIQADLIETRLFSARVSQCTAPTPEARRFYGEKLQELMRRYFELQKVAYPLPSCDEVR